MFSTFLLPGLSLSPRSRAARSVGLLVAALMFVGAGCSVLDSSETIVEPAPQPEFVTMQDTVVVDLDTSRTFSIQANVPYVFRNRTDSTLYFAGCNPPNPPSVERHSDNGTWSTVYAPVVQLCLRPPFALGPGQSYQDTLKIRAGDGAPDFPPPYDALHRLRTVATWDRAGTDTLAQRHQVSNQFVFRRD